MRICCRGQVIKEDSFLFQVLKCPDIEHANLTRSSFVFEKRGFDGSGTLLLTRSDIHGPTLGGL